jgi:cyanophycin synthetase
VEILQIKHYNGRNIYAHKPVLYLEIDLGKYGQRESKEIKGFNEKLLEILPGIAEHQCGISKAKGFKKRLEEGTFFGHVIEHVCLEILKLLEYNLRFGKTRVIKEPNQYFIVFECPYYQLGTKVAECAVKLVKNIIENKKVNLQKELVKLQKIKSNIELGPSTMAIYMSAKNKKIPVKRLDTETSMLQLGTGKYLKRVNATISSFTTALGVDIACDKTLTKKILEKSGINVPLGQIVYTEEQALEVAKNIGLPVVIKPCDGNQGKGVTLNLQTDSEIRKAYKLARIYSNKIMVEKYITGKHYRILVVNGEVVAVAERLPAHVIGTGCHTIKELIDLENQNPLRGENHDKPLTKIKIDPVVKMVLAKQKKSLNYIPAKGEKVFLRENANISTGGIAIDVTDDIHYENVLLAKRIGKIVGLDIAGIDLVTEDIAKPLTKTNGAVIEVNASPGIRMHLYPSVGTARQVGEKIVDYLFPEGSPTSIPIISITGTNGKTTTTRLISHIIRQCGFRVGMTTTDGVFIDDYMVMEGDNTGPISAQVVLDDPSVEVAVLETARGGIIKRGLGYDLADVAVVTNITDDHLGQDGIYTLDDLFFVKSLVVEAVKDNGYLVLNADDCYVRKMAKVNKKAQVIYFTLNPEKNRYFTRHLAIGGKGVFCKDNIVYYAVGDISYPIILLNKVPFTIKGKALHNVQNALAAIGACIALNTEKKEIIKGLQSFDNNIHNPGRLNIYQEKGITVLLDYGHNQDGYLNVLKFAKSLKYRKMILVLGAPGDRENRQYVEMGKLASDYGNIFIIKEDEDLRGRKPGEVAQLFKEGLLAKKVDEGQILIIKEEDQAVKKAVELADNNDLIVVFYEKLQLCKDIALKALQEKQEKIEKIV